LVVVVLWQSLNKRKRLNLGAQVLARLIFPIIGHYLVVGHGHYFDCECMMTVAGLVTGFLGFGKEKKGA
jgi:hypothetical protein